MSRHGVTHHGARVAVGEPIAPDSAAWREMARHGSTELLKALHRYFLRHGDGRTKG